MAYELNRWIKVVLSSLVLANGFAPHTSAFSMPARFCTAYQRIHYACARATAWPLRSVLSTRDARSSKKDVRSIRSMRCSVDRGDFRGNYGELPEGSNKEAQDVSPADTLLRVEVEDYDLAALRQFLRSFPYAAVLPVQPLMFFPTNTGVDVVFRKKPTAERGSTDGGLKITVEEKSVLWDPHRYSGATRTKGAGGLNPQGAAFVQPGEARAASPVVKGRRAGEDQYDTPRATITVTRDTQGQMVSKLFSEKLVVMKLMEALKGLDSAIGRPVSFVSSFVALTD